MSTHFIRYFLQKHLPSVACLLSVKKHPGITLSFSLGGKLAWSTTVLFLEVNRPTIFTHLTRVLYAILGRDTKFDKKITQVVSCSTSIQTYWLLAHPCYILVAKWLFLAWARRKYHPTVFRGFEPLMPACRLQVRLKPLWHPWAIWHIQDGAKYGCKNVKDVLFRKKSTSRLYF